MRIGTPMAAYLIGLGHPVVGVDLSPAMIDVCRVRFPKQEWIVADMRELALRRKFSGILAWNSFFHLCHDDQRQMFPIFRKHAAPEATLMFTSGPAHGEAIGSFGVSRCIMQASTPPNIVRCSIRTGFAWCRMSLRTQPAAATPSGSRSSFETRGANADGERWPPPAFRDYDPVKKKADIGSNFLKRMSDFPHRHWGRLR